MKHCTRVLRDIAAYNTVNPTGDESALAMYLAKQLQDLKPDQLDIVTGIARPHGATGYVYARWGTPRLLLNAHMDTVPANAGWNTDPWTLHDDGEKLTALGACDTKGAMAAIISALHIAPPRDIAVLFSGDEEGSCKSMAAFLASDHKHGIKHAIVCEPTGALIGVKHRGILSLRFEVQGRGGHSSGADHMPAPLADLARLAVALHDFGREQRNRGPDGFQGLCLNIAELHGGVAFNVVPDNAALTVSLRPPPGAHNAEMLDRVLAIATQICPDAVCRIQIDQPAFDAQPSQDFLARFPSPMPERIALPYWTEAALLCEAGIEAVVFGPGHTAQAHAPNEWVTHQQLREVRDTFVGVIIGTC